MCLAVFVAEFTERANVPRGMQHLVLHVAVHEGTRVQQVAVHAHV